PPPPSDFRVDVSRLAQSGWFNISRLIDGTPEKLVAPSRSISSRARPGSHLYMNTTVPPAIVHGWRTQLHDVTWNSGVGAMNTGAAGAGASGSGAGGAGSSPAATALPSAVAVTSVQKIRFKMLCTEPRWVSWAPLGNPVVPDV